MMSAANSVSGGLLDMGGGFLAWQPTKLQSYCRYDVDEELGQASRSSTQDNLDVHYRDMCFEQGCGVLGYHFVTIVDLSMKIKKTLR